MATLMKNHPTTNQLVEVVFLGVIDREDVTWRVYDFCLPDDPTLKLESGDAAVLVRDATELAYIRQTVREA